jgi:hypothetical protein
MNSFARMLASLGLACLLFGAGAALAFGRGTRDGSPPAEETVCSDAGLMGAALGLCIAFCEANDCDAYPDSDACDVLRENYARITGELLLPCEAAPPDEG